MRRPSELELQAQLVQSRARLVGSGARVKQAMEAKLDVRAALQRRAWAFLALAFAVGFWVGRDGNGGRDHAGE